MAAIAIAGHDMQAVSAEAEDGAQDPGAGAGGLGSVRPQDPGGVHERCRPPRADPPAASLAVVPVNMSVHLPLGWVQNDAVLPVSRGSCQVVSGTIVQVRDVLCSADELLGPAPGTGPRQTVCLTRSPKRHSHPSKAQGTRRTEWETAIRSP